MLTVTRHTGQGGSRYYLAEGDGALTNVRFPNVTSITGVLDKPALIGWAERMGREEVGRLIKELDTSHGLTYDAIDFATEQAKGISNRKKNAAADIGTDTHALIERILQGEVGIEIPDNLKTTIENFSNWFNQSGIQSVELTEQQVVSTKYLYGGTIDFTGVMADGTLVVGDWKTSNGLYKETSLQLAAYGQAYIEMYHPELALKDIKLLAVRLGKDYPAFETKEVTNPEDCLTGFLACLRIREWIADMKGTVWEK